MKILSVWAHPDDEVIWGWPVLQNDKYEHGVYYVSDNRPTYQDSLEAAQEFASQRRLRYLGCAGIENEFYRLPTRRSDHVLTEAIHEVIDKLTEIISEFEPDVIFTHNPIGEYGHGDHRLVFEICNQFKLPVWFTNICEKNKCHFSYDTIPLFIRMAYYSKGILEATADKYFLRDGVEIYKKYNCWSWCDNIQQKAGVFTNG